MIDDSEERRIRNSYYSREKFVVMIIGTPKNQHEAKQVTYKLLKDKQSSHQVETFISKDGLRMPADKFFEVSDWEKLKGKFHAVLAFNPDDTEKEILSYAKQSNLPVRVKNI